MDPFGFRIPCSPDRGLANSLRNQANNPPEVQETWAKQPEKCPLSPPEAADGRRPSQHRGMGELCAEKHAHAAYDRLDRFATQTLSFERRDVARRGIASASPPLRPAVDHSTGPPQDSLAPQHPSHPIRTVARNDSPRPSPSPLIPIVPRVRQCSNGEVKVCVEAGERCRTREGVSARFRGHFGPVREKVKGG